MEILCGGGVYVWRGARLCMCDFFFVTFITLFYYLFFVSIWYNLQHQKEKNKLKKA